MLVLPFFQFDEPPQQTQQLVSDEEDEKEKTMDVVLPDSDDSEDENQENLAQPEFEGLWQNHKAYKAPKDLDLGTSAAQKSKMEKVPF